MNANLHDSSDTGSMRGPTVELKSSSDGVSVQVGHEFGATALTAEEWAALAAERGDKPYVLVERRPHCKPYVSPLMAYADAMAAFDHYLRQAREQWRFFYAPDTGRSLRVMSQADYLKASEKWSQS